MAATRPSRMRSASGRKSARPRISRSRCANGRWWRWHAANGTRPRSSPARHAPCCAGPGSRKATRHPWSARCKPARPCTGEMSRRRARQLVSAQRLRPLLTYALPYLAVQARIELTRVHLALADLAGARTLMREVDELLRRRPGLGTLVGEAAGAPGPAVARKRGSSVPGASALTAAELRLLPLLSTHLSFPEIAAEMFLSRNTIKSQAILDLPQAGRLLPQPGGHPVPRARAPGGVTTGLSSHQGDGTRPGTRWNGARRRAEAYGPDGEIPGDPAQAGDDRRRLRRRRGRARAWPGRGHRPWIPRPRRCCR